MLNIFLFFLIFFLTIPEVAFAYIGPGLALGAIVITIGIIALVLLATLSIIYYPIKKMIKNLKLKKIRKEK